MKYDRIWALSKADQKTPDPTRSTVQWQNKSNFAVQFAYPELAAFQVEFGYPPDTLDYFDGEQMRPCDLRNVQERVSFARAVDQYLKQHHQSAPPLFLSGNESAQVQFFDRKLGQVSILNQASLDDLSVKLRANLPSSVEMPNELDIKRFRGNVVLSGMPAWTELQWVGKEITFHGSLQLATVGDAPKPPCRIRITQKITRCSNIDVDPVTGDTSVPLLQTIKEQYNHGYFGVVGEVIQTGIVSKGDRFKLI